MGANCCHDARRIEEVQFTPGGRDELHHAWRSAELEIRRDTQEKQAQQELLAASAAAGAQGDKPPGPEQLWADKAVDGGGQSADAASKSAAEAEAAKQREEAEAVEAVAAARRAEYEALLAASRQKMKDGPPSDGSKPNRYGDTSSLPEFKKGQHIPTLALINPGSGALAGGDILAVARRTPYYQDRFFNIIDVVKGQARGGLLDVFRQELNAAKQEALALNARPRIVSGGGDGTCTFALFIIFKALLAHPERAEDGLSDSGNGFIWTDEEMSSCFPAIAQMPLGSANDLGNILGWRRVYPGAQKSNPAGKLSMLQQWISAVIAPTSAVVNFDIWGIMPAAGQASCDFKLAELGGKRGWSPREKIDGKSQLVLKQAGLPTPFFVGLYFSVGFGGYIIARFQINRHGTTRENDIEYVKQGAGMLVLEKKPPQLPKGVQGVTVSCGGEQYFPPRGGDKSRGKSYLEVGCMNINWQAHTLHGADRAGFLTRLCRSSSRAPVCFNDGMLDMYRMRFFTHLKTPLRYQTDKKRDLTLSYDGPKGTGVFFQYDGEGRFAFSPTGQAFSIHLRKALNIPVVLGPWHDKNLTGETDNGKPVEFRFGGDTEAEQLEARERVFKSLRGELEKELNASEEEIQAAGLHMFQKQ